MAGSLVFVEPGGPVPLDDVRNWWAWVPGADWRHPDGPGSTLDGRERHPVTHVAYADAEAYAAWAGQVAADRGRVGVRGRGGLDGAVSRGATSSRRKAGPWPTRGRAGSRGRTSATTASRPRRRCGRSRPTATASTTWRATCGSGRPTTSRPTTPASPAARAACPATRVQHAATTLCRGRAGRAHAPPGHQGRIAPVRAELLPALPAGRPPGRDDRHVDVAHRLPLHHPRPLSAAARAHAERPRRPWLKSTTPNTRKSTAITAAL